MVVNPLADEPLVGRITATMHEYPTVLWDSEFPRRLRPGHDERRRLVGLDDRVHQLRVRKPYHPVVRSNRCYFFGQMLHPKPGVRISRGDGRETRTELAEPALVLLNGDAEIRAYSVLEQRVNARRHRGPVARLDLVEARPVVAVDSLRRLPPGPRK